MTFSKSGALELLALNEAAYALANTGRCCLPAGYSDPVAIRMPPGDRPFFLQRDPLDIWGYATSKAGTLYLVFRGTQFTSGIEFAQEWAEDALCLPLQPFAGGHVHLGFYGAWAALRNATIDATKQTGAPGLLVDTAHEHASCPEQIITGHSLGAAIATLAWADFNGQLTTFASPRVGDPAFAKVLWDGETMRIINAPDIVPDVPTDPPFRHGGQEIRVLGAGGFFDHKLAHSLEAYRAGIEGMA